MMPPLTSLALSMLERTVQETPFCFPIEGFLQGVRQETMSLTITVVSLYYLLAHSVPSLSDLAIIGEVDFHTLFLTH